MRLLSIVLTASALVLGGCIAEEDDPITNEQGEEVSDPTAALNGFWDGQFDQSGALRVLIYNGNVYALDETNGYYGTVVLDDDSQMATFALTAYTLSENDTSGNQYVADGSEEEFDLSGLLYSGESSDDTLVGDYSNDSTDGSFLLTDDGTWDNNSALSTLAGKWTATGYEFYVETLSGKASFKGISTDASGCTFDGYFRLLDKAYSLYEVELTERKNCNAFNETDAEGYAAINADGELELYLRKDTDLLFMIYTAPATTTDDTTDETDTTE